LASLPIASLHPLFEVNEEKKEEVEEVDEDEDESGEEKNDVEEEVELAKLESQPGCCCEGDVEEEDAVMEEEENVVDEEEEEELVEDEVAVKQVGWPVWDMAMILLVGRLLLEKIITGSSVKCHKCPSFPSTLKTVSFDLFQPWMSCSCAPAWL